MQHQRHRLNEVVSAVVQRLVGVGRPGAAADLQEGMNDTKGGHHWLALVLSRDCFKRMSRRPTEHALPGVLLAYLAGAIRTLCAGGLFDRARQLAGSSPQLLQLVDAQHTQHLVANNNAEELVRRGHAEAAVDTFAAQGNWMRAHELVGTAGGSWSCVCCGQAHVKPR
jgi:hypothetical protein